MPEGKVNSGDFRSGTPIIAPHQFGNTVGTPVNDGNVMPQANATLNSNPVTWMPSPAHFGNQTGFSLQAVPPIIVVAQGSSGMTTIVVTDLGGFTGTVTFSYSGAPAGVTVAFSPASSTTQTTATVTVGGSVPIGKYTITVTGTSGTETETTNIHLTVT